MSEQNSPNVADDNLGLGYDFGYSDSGEMCDLLACLPSTRDEKVADVLENFFNTKEEEEDNCLESEENQGNEFCLSDSKPSSTSGSVDKLSGNESISSTSREKKKRYLAAASRKTRAKKKFEKEKMHFRKMELEDEQEQFRLTIASLQNEIQSLKRIRDSHLHIDMETENRLLRAEVKRHRAFVSHIRKVVHSVPKFTKEEKLRMAKLGIDSSTGQMLGLCYMSVVDHSWKKFDVPLPDGKVAHCRMQLLPHNSDRRTAKRVNVRIDYVNIKGKAKSLMESCWNFLVSKGALEETFKNVYKKQEKEVDVLFTDMGDIFNDSHANDDILAGVIPDEDTEKPRIKLFKYQETFSAENKGKRKHSTVQGLVTFTSKSEVVSSELDIHMGSSVSPPRNIPCQIIGISQCTEEHASALFESPPEPGIHRAKSTTMEVFLFRASGEKDPDTSTATLLFSNPIDPKNFYFCEPEYAIPLDESGSATKAFIEEVQIRYAIATGQVSSTT